MLKHPRRSRKAMKKSRWFLLWTSSLARVTEGGGVACKPLPLGLTSGASCRRAGFDFSELYQGFRVDRVTALRAVNCDPSKRGPVSELIVRNY